MRNARLDEAKARIKTARTNVSNISYADDTILKAESEGELKSLLMKVKEESEKAGLELNIHCFLAFWLRSSVELNIKKTKIMHPVPSIHGK